MSITNKKLQYKYLTPCKNLWQYLFQTRHENMILCLRHQNFLKQSVPYQIDPSTPRIQRLIH